MIRFLSFSLLALALVLFAAPDLQAQYKIEQLLGNDNFGNKSTGQTFTPSVGIVPNPGSITTIDLTQIMIKQGNSGAYAPSATTYLNIYDGDPNGAGVFVGSSTNYVDTNNPVFHTPMTWTFNGLTLDYNIEYWAIMSSTDTAGALDVACSLETHDRNMGNVYTGGTGLTANMVPHSSSVDATFSIDLASGPAVDVKCNGGDSAVMVPVGTNAKIDYDVVAGSAAGTSVDIWIVLISPFGPFSYSGTGPVSGWHMGLGYAYFTGSLADANGTALDRTIPLGSYKAHIGIDGVANGKLDFGSIVVKDKVDFTVF